MKKFHLTIAALLCLSSAACAETAPRVAAGASSTGGQTSSTALVAPTAFNHIVRNANDCAPDHPDAVWGANSTLLGYACSDSANGS